MRRMGWCGLMWCASAGCGGDAALELAASQTLNAAADQMALALDEYHQEVSGYDASREAAVVAAFIQRVRSSGDDAAALDEHAAAFEAALVKIRQDRDTEWQRRNAGIDNVEMIREVSRGLERVAVESLTLQDEIKRYLTDWIELRRQASRQAGVTGGAQ